VKQHVARSSGRIAIARAEFPEGMQFNRPGLAEELVPGIGSEARDAREAGVDVAELDGANQPGEVTGKRAQGCVTLRLDGDHQEDRCAREWSEH
jgi:hypothetical protein